MTPHTSASPNLPVIRLASFDDAPFIVDCQLRMAWETESLRLAPPTVTRGVAALFDHPQRGQYWIACLDHHPAACLLTIPEWSDWRNGTILWIHSVFVLPDFRRRGLFRAMYQHLADSVRRDPSLKGLRLIAARDNTRAHQTYRQLGMSNDHYQLFEWLKD